MIRGRGMGIERRQEKMPAAITKIVTYTILMTAITSEYMPRSSTGRHAVLRIIAARSERKKNVKSVRYNNG